MKFPVDALIRLSGTIVGLTGSLLLGPRVVIYLLADKDGKGTLNVYDAVIPLANTLLVSWLMLRGDHHEAEPGPQLGGI